MSDPSPRPPAATPEAGWLPVNPFAPAEITESFLIDHGRGQSLRVAYFQRDTDGRLVGRAWFGPGTAGPPGHAHGGSVAAVLDEALGAAAWLAGHPALVARLVVDFRQMVPLGTDATFEAWVEAVEGRKVRVRARLTHSATLLAEAEAICVMLPPDRVDEFRILIGDRVAGPGG